MHTLSHVGGPVPTHGGQHVVQILLVDEAVPVLVDHVESLLELLDLGLVEHGKDVGCGPLGPLLGGLPLGALARHGAVRMWPCSAVTSYNLGIRCVEKAPVADHFLSLHRSSPALKCQVTRMMVETK